MRSWETLPIVSLAAGFALTDAARFASAAAALSVGRAGAQPAMPDGAETRAFMEEHER